MKHRIMLLAVGLLVACVTYVPPQVKEPEPLPAAPVRASFDRTWATVIDFFADQAMEAFFGKLQNKIEGFGADGFAQFSLEQLFNLAIDKLFDRFSGLLTLQNRRDMLRQFVLQGGNRIQHRSAGAGRQSLNQRRIDGGKQFIRVGVNKAFDLAAEESGFKERLENSFLRNEFVADGVANRLGQPVAMPWNHSLWPNGNTEKFDRPVRVKQHPDRQPRRAVTVRGGDDDDRQTN